MPEKSKTFTIFLPLNECRKILQEIKQELDDRVLESSGESIRLRIEGEEMGKEMEAYLKSLESTKTNVEVSLSVRRGLYINGADYYLDSFIKTFAKKAVTRLDELGTPIGRQDPISVQERNRKQTEIPAIDIELKKYITRCDNCGTETEAGTHYQIHYGRVVDTARVQSGNQITTTIRYKMSGVTNIFLCYPCVAIQMMKDTVFVAGCIAGFIGFGTLFGFALTNSGSLGGETPLYLKILLGTVLIAFLFFSLSLLQKRARLNKVVSSRDQESLRKMVDTRSGEELSLALTKTRLKKHGYDSFFTPEAGFGA